MHKEQEYREADSYTKLAEQVILADEALSFLIGLQRYEKAGNYKRCVFVYFAGV